MGQALPKGTLTTESLLSSVRPLLETSVNEKVFPGCVCYLAQGSSLLGAEVIGNVSYTTLEGEEEVRPVQAGTVYDVDALTSSLVTTTLAMKAYEEGRFALSDRVSRYIHGFGVFGKSPIRIEDLLLHRSGLPATDAAYLQLDSIQKSIPFGTPVGRGVAQHLYTVLNRIEVRTAPGVQQQYSEIGTLVLGHLLEGLWAKRIDELADKFIFRPLKLRASGFVDHGLVRQGKLAPMTDVIAPSEECPWRKRVLHGEVRDENTWAIGGASGEAGLFATAEDITTLVQSILSAYHGKAKGFLQREVVRSFLNPSNRADKDGNIIGSWQLGWANAKAAFGVEPPKAFSRSLGAVSPTGCAVWMDPESSLSLVLLSNRTMPHRSNRKIGQFWPRLFSEMWSTLEQFT